jgi:hypothetical protein
MPPPPGPPPPAGPPPPPPSAPPPPPGPPPGPPPAPLSSGHPVQLSIAHAERYSRALAVLGLPFLYLRFLAVLPVLVYLFVVGVAAFLTAWAMQFAVLFSGVYPAGPHAFLSGYLQASTRAGAWALGLVDRYPGLSLRPSSPAGGPPAHPVELSVARPPRSSRGLALLGCVVFVGRVVALVPVALLLYFLRIAAVVVSWAMQFAVLFSGRYPSGAHGFVSGYLRLESRAEAWLYGLVDRYPGFDLQP